MLVPMPAPLSSLCVSSGARMRWSVTSGLGQPPLIDFDTLDVASFAQVLVVVIRFGQAHMFKHV